MPPAAALATPDADAAPAVVQRVKFDVWLWFRDIDNIAASVMFDAAPMTIGRWRKRFDDPDRRVPTAEKIAEIEAKTAGDVGLQDWLRPCPVTYVDPDAVTRPELAERLDAGVAGQ